MTSFEEQFKNACESREIPGVVLLAADRTGNFKYAKAFGPKSPQEPMTLDSTFIMASCTKLMASIAALQCVERGQIGLDDDASTVLPELKGLQILTGFNKTSGEPEFKQAKNKITLRTLITHTSGLPYEQMDPLMARWSKFKCRPPGLHGYSMLDRIQIPLRFEPGTSWMYGVGIDWAGLLVARLSNMTLEDYMQKYIWDPVGIKNITFHQELKPEVRKNLVTLTYRGGIDNPKAMLAVDTGKPVVWTHELIYDDPVPIGDDFGGHGAIGSGSEYIKILISILRNDSKLLKPATVDVMFSPQLGQGSKAALKAFNEAPYFKDTFASHEVGIGLDWGLSGMLNLDEERTGRRKGTLTWSGYPNLLWTIDRDAGLVTLYCSNVLPFGDVKSHQFQQLFETEMYSRSNKLAKL